MKRVYTLTIFWLLLFGCKKEVSVPPAETMFHKVEVALKDSMTAADYASIDFSKALFNRVDSACLYFFRIPFKGSKIENDFVLVKASKDGGIEKGSIVHLDGKQSEYGTGTIKQRRWDGSVVISSLDRKRKMTSPVRNGYITAFHPKLATREQVLEAPDLPEVIVVAYVHYDTGIDFSTWLWLNSYLYINSWDGGGGGDPYSGYYGSSDGGGDYYGGGGTSDGSGVSQDETMYVDVDTYVDHAAIDVNQYLKCFDNIPDQGATCSIEIFSDIPVDSDPSKLFNWQTRSPGHTFLQLKKTNGSQSIIQNIGFYPKDNWKNILSADPVDSKMVDDGVHEYNASLKMNLTPYMLSMVIGKIKELSTFKYDMDEFNCTDFALEVFNYVRTPLQIPQYVIPGGIFATNTPQGLYNKLKEMKATNDPEASNVSIGFYKGYVAHSNGPCY